MMAQCMLAIITLEQIQQLLQRLWDPVEFRSEYGLRSLSKYHEAHPYVFGEHVVRYSPGNPWKNQRREFQLARSALVPDGLYDD